MIDPETLDAGPVPSAPLHRSKLAILLAAERLFAESGIARASLRDISMAAGQKNRSAAQYHFKDRDGLILAILKYRRPQVDFIRAEYFRQMGLKVEACSDQLLIKCILQPLPRRQSDESQRAYSRFLYALLHYDKGQSLWMASAETAPFTHRIYDELRRRMSDLPDDVWEMRLRLFGRVCTDMAANYDVIIPEGMPLDGKLVDETCSILLAIFRAPTSA